MQFYLRGVFGGFATAGRLPDSLDESDSAVRSRTMRSRASASPDDAARQAESHAMSTGSTFGKGNPKP